MFKRRATVGLACLAAPLLAMVTAACGSGTGAQSASESLSGFTTIKPGVLTIATEIGSPGWVDGETADKLTGGVEYEMGKQFAEKLGLTPKFVNVSFTPLVSGAVRDYDIGMMSIFRTPERAKVNQYSDCYYEQPTGLITTAEQPVTDITAAKKVLWGIEIGSYAEQIVTKLDPDTKVKKFDSQPSEYAALQSGTIGGVMGDFTSMLRRAEQPELKEAGARVDAVIQLAGTGPSCQAVQLPRSAPAKNLDLINQEIKTMQTSGQLNQWIEQNFPGATKPYPVINVP